MVRKKKKKKEKKVKIQPAFIKGLMTTEELYKDTLRRRNSRFKQRLRCQIWCQYMSNTQCPYFTKCKRNNLTPVRSLCHTEGIQPRGINSSTISSYSDILWVRAASCKTHEQESHLGANQAAYGLSCLSQVYHIQIIISFIVVILYMRTNSCSSVISTHSLYRDLSWLAIPAWGKQPVPDSSIRNLLVADLRAFPSEADADSASQTAVCLGITGQLSQSQSF